MRRALVLFAIGCSRDPEPIVLDGEGVACVLAADADERISISVRPEPCESCYGSQFEAACSVELVGSTVEVTSEASYVFEHTNERCSADCDPWVVQCESVDPLPAGTYELAFGRVAKSFDVPLEAGVTVCAP